AAAYGELTGHRDLIAFDMGGTTAKLALIENGQPGTTTAFELHRVHGAAGSGLPMNIQALDLVEIGAGGGSIARAQLGVVAVGPGPVHGCRLAQALGVPRVILPAAAGVTAAIGLLAAEVRFDVARTLVRRLDALDPHALTVMFDEMAAQATAVVRDSGPAATVTIA